MRAWLDAEPLARGVVQRHDLAAHSRTLGDLPARPRDTQFLRDAGARDLPGAAVTVDVRHHGARDLDVGCRGEGASDEQVVFDVVVVHVSEDGGDDVGFEDVRHVITVRLPDVAVTDDVFQDVRFRLVSTDLPGVIFMHLVSSRRWRAAAAGAAALALVLTGCSPEDSFSYTPPEQVDAALPDETAAQLQAAVENAMVTTGATGAIVGVWVPWSGTWVTGLGTQSVEDQTEITTDMTFRIADVTRMMTCDVLYGLVDDDVVELDASVPEYVSGVAHLEDITLLDLCNGTSGVGSSEAAVKGMWLNTPERVWPALELASFGLGLDPVAQGTTYRDSDAGYLLLGLALERASGKSASELIAEYVTRPLDLAGTSLPGSKAATPGDIALSGNYLPAIEGGFECTAPSDITVLSSSTGFTDSGVVSTIDDLGRYVQATSRQALRDEGAEPGRFSAPLPVSPKAESWYQATGGAYMVGPLVGQHGWTPGYATAAYSDPETGFTVAVVLNNSTAGGSPAAYLAWELAAIASKAPAASGQTAPEFGLPFTAEQYHQAITDRAICATPPAGE